MNHFGVEHLILIGCNTQIQETFLPLFYKNNLLLYCFHQTLLMTKEQHKKELDTSIWKIEVGSRYPLAISMSMLHVSFKIFLLKMRIFLNISYREEDDDPGAGVVVLAVGVDQADGVEQGRVERPHICELCRLKGLAFSS